MSQYSLKSQADFLRILGNLPTLDTEAVAAVQARQDTLTKPQGSLGRLEDITLWLAGWQRKTTPTINKPQCIVFAGNHGVTNQGVSAYPSNVTAQMVANFKAGGAAINQLCTLSDIKLDVVPIDLDTATGDISETEAMSAEECMHAFMGGFDAVDTTSDLLLLGEMGIGNTTVAAALCLAAFGGDAPDWVGSGTGISSDVLARKSDVVQSAVDLHSRTIETSFDLIQKLGGRELAAIAGATVRARLENIPVILDGFIATSAAATLIKSSPTALDHCMVSHLSAEHGHQKLCSAIGKNPILNLDMRLGEASGAATAFSIVRAAIATFNGMATFDGAEVSTKT
ncbi:nicotinate-nucleotide--dimethylbenzimidazole phosphoribosyltransferase [Kordiimonas sp. SCSIO 12610]|uniref:nicotinate-nucleotide--dimethylbenzimidazole phosphoribosyltransferase n=1 Tax=Kordiimonas sp. SCSIO 12610 TaxID=2829597 RepID=UPI00210A5028|nr:nicotinate-nucleotide--dimethylbenzimidazole phosphoribosyltransferase [Kordiimonas sp. SCSIO 12610]UTW55937.1 nicotinate-nucleotide--dimethylbenzimidazole phosphoribosyltransferase [Kordiimonas sp. SCSIO 12610]